MPQMTVHTIPITTTAPEPGMVIGPIDWEPGAKNWPTSAATTAMMATIGVSGYRGTFHLRVLTESAPFCIRYRGWLIEIISHAYRNPNDERLATKMYAELG